MLSYRHLFCPGVWRGYEWSKAYIVYLMFHTRTSLSEAVLFQRYTSTLSTGPEQALESLHGVLRLKLEEMVVELARTICDSSPTRE